MIDLSSPELWVIAAMGVAVGVFIGWAVTSVWEKRAGGGKKVVELRKELEDYRGEVNHHFAQTAELFREMTEKYRDVYEHLASGAQNLCTDLPDPARLEFQSGRLLADAREPEPSPGVAAKREESPASGSARAATAAVEVPPDVETDEPAPEKREPAPPQAAHS